MTLAAIIFYLFAAFTIVSGVFILFTKNILYAGFALLCALLGVAAIYVFAGADFLAVAQIMIYIGGILILILFGVMLTNRSTESKNLISANRSLFAGILSGSILLGLLITAIVKAKFSDLHWIQDALRNQKILKTTVGTIGTNLMTDFVLPFEIAGLILIVALIGAAFIASQVVKK
jgi:NADH:ubiquinone oxidoreductase subunit 6 (subunit J)